MTPERWARIQELFNGAMDLLAEDRLPYLDHACEGDEDLKRQVHSLILASSDADAEIAGVVRAAAQEVGALVGDEIGAYRVVRELGRGGMGTVYLAKRADEHYRQQVAIKVVAHGFTNTEILNRFQSERQILANLNHPNIARLLDGGTTRGGLPYLVMEYIEGVPIDQYCDEHRLSTRERLELFRSVCEAVQVAHQNLVVHRDIKPSNILVSSDGVPKLLDFGIAKLLRPEDASHTIAMTRVDARLLTPEHASPEQVRGETITTASDIYTLGILLYQLLSGRRPYRITSDSPGEMEQAICETQPARPSAAVLEQLNDVADDFGDRQTVGRNRKTSLDKLSRELSGDLDNIVLMAMRKEPERRYNSVQQLSEDIKRYLRDLPVLARPDTWRYRSQKFIRRHRVGLSVTIAAISLLVAIVTFYTIELTEERNRAQLEAQNTQEIADFMQGLFEVADPSVSKGETITARELLDAGAAKLRDELEEQPRVQARLMHTVGAVYQRLGLYPSAESLLREAQRVRASEFGADHPEYLDGEDALAALLYDIGDYSQTLEVSRRNLERRRRLANGDDPGLALSIHNVSWILYEMDELEEALAHGTEALTMRTALFGEIHEDTAESINALGAYSMAAGDQERATNLFRQSLGIRQELFGDDHYRVAESRNNLAEALKLQGELEEAEQLMRESLATYEKLYEPDHPQIVSGRNYLGMLLLEKSQFGEAEKALRAAVDSTVRLRGRNNWYTAYYQANLATVLIELGRADEAQALLEHSVTIYEDTYDKESAYHANALRRLGEAQMESGNPQEALFSLERAIAQYDALGLASDLPRQLANNTLGACLSRLRRAEDAEPLLESSLIALRTLLNADSYHIAKARARLAQHYTELGRFEDAQRLTEE